MKLIFVFLIALLFLLKPVKALPIWSQNQESVSSGSQYLPMKSYSFQINWVGSNESYTISNVSFESNFEGALVNVTASNKSNIYFVNFTDLPAGNYVYRWYAMDNESNWNSTDQFNYVVNINSSASIRLYLNRTEGNRSYNLNDIANFTAFLNIPNKLIYLSSNYPGFGVKSNYSAVYNLTNLSSLGLFSITAYWDGDQNYSASSKTYFFDNIPPQYSNKVESPSSPVAYSPDASYKFSINWIATLKQVLFESNYTGSFRNYTSSTTPSIQNNSNNFFITLTDLPAETFAYRWIAIDSLNRVNDTGQYYYYIVKPNPLVLQIVPSAAVANGTETIITCLSLANEIGASNFKLFRDSTLIVNNTQFRRMDDQTLNPGTYQYTCNNTATQNYTNQSISATINVILNNTLLNLNGTLILIGPPLIQSNLNESFESNFYLENNLGYSLNNLLVDLTGISSNWYKISELTTSIPNNFSLLIKINFSISSNAEQGNYNFTLRALGKTPLNETKLATKLVTLSVATPPPPQNFPPVYSTPSINKTAYGYEFSLKWNDDADLSGYIFSSNLTGTWVKDSWIPFLGKEAISYAYKNITLNPNSVISWKFYANDSSNLWTESEEYNLKVVKENNDMTTPITIVSIFVICLAILLLFITQRKSKKSPKKEELTYVYRKEDIK